MGDEATIKLGPLDRGQFIPGMRAAWIADPEGNIVELNQGYVDEDSAAAAARIDGREKSWRDSTSSIRLYAAIEGARPLILAVGGVCHLTALRKFTGLTA